MENEKIDGGKVWRRNPYAGPTGVIGVPRDSRNRLDFVYIIANGGGVSTKQNLLYCSKLLLYKNAIGNW